MCVSNKCNFENGQFRGPHILYLINHIKRAEASPDKAHKRRPRHLQTDRGSVRMDSRGHLNPKPEHTSA